MRTGTLLLAVLLAAQPARAQQTVYGSIESLDMELGTITLLLPPKHEPKQFNLAKPDLPTTNALGQPLKLAGLREKQRVALMLDEAEDVAGIRVDDNVLWAYVMKVDAKEGQLAIKYGHVQRTLSVPEKTLVLLDGEKIALDDLKIGQGIKAIFAPDQTLVQIQCGKGISGVSPYHRWILESAIVLKVDPEKRKLQTVRYLEPIQLQEFDYQPEAILRLVYSALSEVSERMSSARCPGKRGHSNRAV